MNVGNTVHEIFGRLPEKAALYSEPALNQPLYTNLHVHLPPNFGSIQSIDDAIAHAKQEQIVVLGASNYYDHTIYTTFAQAAVKAGIIPVFGVEVLTMDEALQAGGILTNDPKNPGKLYICGKGLTRFDDLDDATLVIWQKIRSGDAQRIEQMIDRLNQIDFLGQCEIRLQYDVIAQTVAEEKRVPVHTVFLQERHLVQALQQAIWEHIPEKDRAAWLQQLYGVQNAIEAEDVVKVQNDLRTYLLKQGRAAYVDECFVSPEEAAQLILGLGGYVSYPALIDGAPSISPFEGPPEVLVEHLLERKIPAAEVIPTRNNLDTLTLYVKTLRAYGIAVGAGTEHNDAVWLPLLPHCKRNVPLSDELLSIFWEGACVAVAHQYLQAKGAEKGVRFLPDAAARHSQIQELAAIGASVIATFTN
ncbi:DNA polymerase III [Candidatus Vecturithrix granuli]|uniref:DNA polymerase III n=1 Tax=Vecturithrix granuli TaxID=1499967 RepID=A0A081BYJ9_VECG1|nr:DNA polymerase III [Candidatus Vecturithrix granuli]